MALVPSRSAAVPLTCHPSSSDPVPEKADHQLWNAKKIKSGDITGGLDPGKQSYGTDWPPLSGGGGETAIPIKASFIDKLKGVVSEFKNKVSYCEEMILEFEDSISQSSQEEDEEEKDFKMIEDPHRNFLEFVFSKKVKKRLYTSWKRFVTVKLLGRTIRFKALESRLQSIWAKHGVLTLIDIGNGYFIAKLTNQSDYDLALTGGPWMIYDHYLTIRPWEPKFNSMRATIDKVAAWVRFPLIPTEYYDEEVLTHMGNRLGQTLKVDMNTTCQLRGLFARVCVLLDLDKAFVSGFKMDSECYYLEYEGLHMLCSKCGRYGHHPEGCPNKPQSNDRYGAPTNSNSGNGGMVDEQKAQNCEEAPEIWKVVQKPRRQRKNKEKNEGVPGNQATGSRFQALAKEQDEGTVQPTSHDVTPHVARSLQLVES